MNDDIFLNILIKMNIIWTNCDSVNWRVAMSLSRIVLIPPVAPFTNMV